MSAMTIPDLDDDLKARLRVRAAQHGWSMEEEARQILQAALRLAPAPGTGAALVADIRALVEPFGGIELELPLREPTRPPLDFGAPESDE
ncbi:MAG: plasmid stabilization protein [Xanthomonadales bacterium]|nr:plasmid stabilization protein [Xanthomonadales bacterium]